MPFKNPFEEGTILIDEVDNSPESDAEEAVQNAESCKYKKTSPSSNPQQAYLHYLHTPNSHGI